MTATNHALTGAIIGLSLSNPYLAIPLALASHFALDALPHYGIRGNLRKILAGKRFLITLIIDIALCIILAISLSIIRPINWQMGIFCAFIASSPDLMWVKMFIAARARHRLPKIKDSLSTLHSKIQWFQRPIGAFVEVAWFASAIFFLGILIK